MGFDFMGDPIDRAMLVETPFTSSLRNSNEKGVWTTWGGYGMPETLAGIRQEARAARSSAMLEDKSPLVTVHIRGPDSERFVNRLIPRDAGRISVDHAYYTPWCDEDGKVIVEGLLFRLTKDDFFLTSCAMDRWFNQQRQGMDVGFEDATDRFGILALQGPDSLAVLEEATGQRWSDLRFSRGRRGRIGAADVHVWRTGFTGVKGYELWVPPAAGDEVWNALAATRAAEALEPCGTAAQDIVRVEAGLVLPAIDYARAGPDTVKAHSYGLAGAEYFASPFEIDLGRFVDFSKPDFVGRDALRSESRTTGSGRRMRALRIAWRELVEAFLARDELPLIDETVRRFPPLELTSEGARVGYATSVGWSHALKDMIGFAHLPATFPIDGEPVQVRWPDDGRVLAAGVRFGPLPFIRPNRK
ncbi:MAG: aminomethyltransferase family protein [bacterium]|nr:aminomethyltransferase family protein [bacterium]MDE0288818.1 aminomethyltransferase family protein [bacterium]MDE0438564.1 aminomethyltransferase family protein [bacterium]